MLAEFLQFLFSGLTVGATYALAALGFTIVYNASNVINFAQGEFLMLGGMLAVVLLEAGAPAWVALPAAILLVAAAGVAVERLAIRPARDAEMIPTTAAIETTIVEGSGTAPAPAWALGPPVEPK